MWTDLLGLRQFLVNLQLWRVSKNLRTAPLKVLHCLYPHFSSQSHIIYYQKHMMGVKEDTKARAERGGPSREGVLLRIGGISSLCDITKGWIPKLSVLTDTFWKEERAQEVEEEILWFPFQAGDTSLSEKTVGWILNNIKALKSGEKHVGPQPGFSRLQLPSAWHTPHCRHRDVLSAPTKGARAWYQIIECIQSPDRQRNLTHNMRTISVFNKWRHRVMDAATIWFERRGRQWGERKRLAREQCRCQSASVRGESDTK